MGETTGISWTHHTFNPWWGCTRVSPACEHCYAETWAKRFGVEWGVKAERRIASEKVWREPARWNLAAEKAGERRRVFCASMADVFEDRRDLDAHRTRLFALIEATPWLDWLLLTKRIGRVMSLVPEAWWRVFPANVWIGTTVEDQRRADERMPILAQIPASVRFVSCEPLLDPVDLWPWMYRGQVDWVIIGGESGRDARAMDLATATMLFDSCKAAGVPVFIKQDSGPRSGQQGRLSDAMFTTKQFPIGGAQNAP